MKIISWNVNGIRAVAKKWFKEFVEFESPDVLCLQETKAFEDQFLKDVWELEWYDYVWHTGERAWYAGTAIFYKQGIEVTDVKNIFEGYDKFHSDGRVTQITFEYTPLSAGEGEKTEVVLFNWYFPNGWTRADGTEMLTYKLWFYDDLIEYANALKNEWKEVILTWDFNIVHTAIDIARPKENENTIWFLPIEREKIWELFNHWYSDVWRNKNPDTLEVYSWWSYRAGARPRNVWWRIDYFAITDEALSWVEDIKYLTDIMGSDHCPVMLQLK